MALFLKVEKEARLNINMPFLSLLTGETLTWHSDQWTDRLCRTAFHILKA